jgi:arachidonate 15-lipoxygenase
MYPPLDLAQKQLNTLQLLGGVYYNLLGEYETGGLISRAWFEDPAIVEENGPLARFRARLAEIETVITTRNRQRDTPYPYLLPSLIPASINI